MDNLKELMKKDYHKYTKRERKNGIRAAAEILGYDKYLVIAMEEMAELSEVITSNALTKVDYIHTAEEIADVMIAAEIIQCICDIPTKELKKPNRIKKHVLITSVRNLSKAQQNISKYIRWHKNGYSKAVEALNLINNTIPGLMSLFKIKKKDISKIMDIKAERLRQRMENGTLH